MASKRSKRFNSLDAQQTRTKRRRASAIFSSDKFPNCIGKFSDCPKPTQFEEMTEPPHDCKICPFGKQAIITWFEEDEKNDTSKA